MELAGEARAVQESASVDAHERLTAVLGGMVIGPFELLALRSTVGALYSQTLTVYRDCPFLSTSGSQFHWGGGLTT